MCLAAWHRGTRSDAVMGRLWNGETDHDWSEIASHARGLRRCGREVHADGCHITSAVQHRCRRRSVGLTIPDYAGSAGGLRRGIQHVPGA
eukprot:14906767-Alexandrium_andersonii.AAC.1